MLAEALSSWIPEARSMLRADSISVLNHSCRGKPLLGKTHVSAKSFSDLSISNDLKETNEKHVSTAALQDFSFLLCSLMSSHSLWKWKAIRKCTGRRNDLLASVYSMDPILQESHKLNWPIDLLSCYLCVITISSTTRSMLFRL